MTRLRRNRAAVVVAAALVALLVAGTVVSAWQAVLATRAQATVHGIAHITGGGLRDNLRLIKGIGPAIEKTLNELGIFRYHQIAEMTGYDIDRVAQRLKGFSSRIYREDWIGQARDLQLKKSGT